MRVRGWCGLALTAAALLVLAAVDTDLHPAPAADQYHIISGFAVAHFPDTDRYAVTLSLNTRVNDDYYQEVARVDTDDIGDFSFSEPDGTYYLLAYPSGDYGYPDSGVMSQWYLGSYQRATATPIELAGGDVRLADIGLAPTPRFSGRVVDESGRPVPNAQVNVSRYQGLLTKAEGIWMDPDQHGSFSGWAYGDLAVYVNDRYRAFAPEWYRDQSLAQDATPIESFSDTVLPPIVVGPGGSISGVVTGDDGKPARHIRIALTNTMTFKEAATQNTDVTGHYVVRHLAPGSYNVTFTGGSGSILGDDYDSDSHDDVRVTDHRDTRLDITLTRQARRHPTGPFVEGRVVDDQGRPLRDVRVAAVDPGDMTDDPVQMDRFGEDYTDPDGIYRIGIHQWDVGKSAVLYLQDGVSYGEFSPTPVGREYDVTPTFGPGDVVHMKNATRFTLPDNRLDVDQIVMRETGGITGSVREPDGYPPSLYLGAVTAYDSAGNEAESADIEADGHYFLDHLPAGSYRLWFGGYGDPTESEGSNLPNWWRGATAFSSATPIAVQAGQTVTDVSATIVPRERIITGTVVDALGRPLAGVYVDPVEIGEEGQPMSRPYTDPDGHFRLTLLPGQYKLGFGSSDEQRFRPLWYGGGTSEADAAVFTVPEGQPPQDLGQIRVSPYPVISGRVTDALGQPAPRVRVVAYLADGEVSASTTTVGDGSYQLRLAAGSVYRLGYWLAGARGPHEYYSESRTFAQALPLPIGNEEQRKAVDEVLLSDSTPLPLPTPSPTGVVTPTLPGTTASSRMSVRDRYRRGPRHHPHVSLIAEVTAAGAAGIPSGEVTVTDRGRVVATGTLSGGRVKLVVPHPHRRWHRYVLTYSGSDAVAGTTSSVRVHVT